MAARADLEECEAQCAEGIVDLFGHAEKASTEVADLAAQITSATQRARLEASRSARLERKLY